MKPKKIWANFAVSDLERTTKFYRELGFKSNGASNDLTSFFVSDNDFIIHFFLKDVLKTNTGLDLVDPQKENEIIFPQHLQKKWTSGLKRWSLQGVN